MAHTASNPLSKLKNETMTPAITNHDFSKQVALVRAYHQRTKHRLDGYAPGPDTIDWSAPPDPFRRFAGSRKILLPLCTDQLSLTFDQLNQPHSAQVLNLDSIGQLLQWSFALAAWKEYGPDRWALRINPSSGNLHPTEAYLIVRAVNGLADGLYHYGVEDHSLTLRRADTPSTDAASSLYIGLSNITWREAWKYGERAFRYCQLDTGHALGAIRYALACLGWTARLLQLDHATLNASLGLDRSDDFAKVEKEEAELLLAVHLDSTALTTNQSSRQLNQQASQQHNFIASDNATWYGQASRIDAHPMYQWPVIEQVAHATRATNQQVTTTGLVARLTNKQTDNQTASSSRLATDVITQRRSAQRFDHKHEMPAEQLWQLLCSLHSGQALPFDLYQEINIQNFCPPLHMVLFIHRVTGLAPGVYILPRSEASTALLKQTLNPDFVWQPIAIPNAPTDLNLYLLQALPAHFIARRLSCAQAIAGDCNIAWSMLAEWDNALVNGPAAYRHLHWEAGLLGQILYLQAENMGLRGTGIGCYFDDACHEFLGMRNEPDQQAPLQAIYHFSLGLPLVDQRIQSHPPYSAERMAMPAGTLLES